ncbi:hypothetical protein AAC387_Pa07g2953 [Persea americana]
MEAAAPLAYADSVESSPRSRHTDSWDSPPSSSQPPPLTNAGPSKLRLMCSYGGHIVPRPHDKSLCYLGGTTRIVVFDRHSSLSSLSSKLSSALLDNRSFSIKYQLPNEDLDSLISVSTDEDFDNMIEEYDRILAGSSNSTSSSNSSNSRLRLFLFPPSKPESASSIGSLLEDSKSETWFVDALNGAGVIPRGLSADSSPDVNCLLGLDEGSSHGGATGGAKNPHLPESPSGKVGKVGQDIHSVPDSPMMETSSSFGSTSSAPCLSNLPPIRVHVDEGGLRTQDPRLGLEEQFRQMNVGGGPAAASAAAVISPAAENPSRVFSDDERFEQGMARKPPQPPSQPQQKFSALELQNDAVSRDGSDSSGVISRQKAGFYQETVVPVHTRERVSPSTAVSSVSDPKRDVSDQNYLIPLQGQDPGFVLPIQQQEQQQFIHTTPHYIHHHATGPVPMSSYYPIHPQQPQQHRIDHQYPMYFVPVGQNQAYNLPIQSNLPDPHSNPSTKLANPAIISSAAVYKERSPSPAYPTAVSASLPKPELAANLYRTAAAPPPMAAQPLAAAAAPLIHVSDQQQQYMGYHQLHHPSQTVAAAAATANFTYEYTDPMHAQLYYTQQTSATLAPQYQTVSSGAMISEIPMPPHSAANAKQNRTSQPL